MEADFTYGLLDRTQKGSNPREICAALPESGGGSSQGIYSLKRTDLMFKYDALSSNTDAVFCFSAQLKVASPWARVACCAGTASTH